jgi:hypothetical protein
VGGVAGQRSFAGLRWLPSITTDLPHGKWLDVRSVMFIAAVTIVAAVISGLPQAWRRRGHGHHRPEPATPAHSGRGTHVCATRS